MPRRSLIAAAAAAIVLAAAPSAAATAVGRLQPLLSSATAGRRLSQSVPRLTESQPLATCEHGLEHARGHAAGTLAVVGASFTAGAGPGVAAGSWAVLLAHMLMPSAQPQS